MLRAAFLEGFSKTCGIAGYLVRVYPCATGLGAFPRMLDFVPDAEQKWMKLVRRLSMAGHAEIELVQGIKGPVQLIKRPRLVSRQPVFERALEPLHEPCKESRILG